MDGGPDDYDLVVLGSGSAAFAAAIAAVEAGASVTLMESGVVGGTCVNVGCIPSKAMLASARRDPDLAAMVDAKAALVDRVRTEKYLDVAAAHGFTICPGRAEFTDARTIRCDGEPVRGRRYLVATGASPAVPPIPGLREAGCLTSTTALDLREPPPELAVIGASAIGLEIGQLFTRLGTRVTYLEMAERVAPFEEPEVGETMRAVLEEQGAEVFTGARVTALAASGDRRQVTFWMDGAPRTVVADQVLVATGRRPNSDGIGLERAGIAVTEGGAIQVDRTLRTTNPRVWAAGDVTGHPQFVYVAAHEGGLAARNALTGSSLEVDLEGLPRVIFTSPAVAAAGLTESQAIAAGIDCDCRVLPMSAVPRALVDRDPRGFVKIVAEAATRRILGVTVVAEGAGDVIQSAVYAVRFGLTVDQVASTWAPYLTFAEGFKLAAQAFDRDVGKLSCCAA